MIKERGREDLMKFLLQDLYQLNQYIQESLAREQLLENKILGGDNSRG